MACGVGGRSGPYCSAVDSWIDVAVGFSMYFGTVKLLVRGLLAPKMLQSHAKEDSLVLYVFGKSACAEIESKGTANGECELWRRARRTLRLERRCTVVWGRQTARKHGHTRASHIFEQTLRIAYDNVSLGYCASSQL